MNDAVDALAAQTPRGPVTPGAGAADAGAPRFGRTLLAPFIFGLAVGYIWFLIRQIVWLGAVLRPAAGWFSMPSLVLLVLGTSLLMVLPGTVAVVSTVGDTRFWGAGRMVERVSAGARLALALIVALVVGNLTWISSFIAAAGRLELAQRIVILNQIRVAGEIGGIVDVQWAFLIGVLAAFTFGRWPVPARRLVPLARAGRWLALGALAAAGLLFFDVLRDQVLLIAVRALWRLVGGACGRGLCPPNLVALRELTTLGRQVGDALVGGVVGGVIGGVLRAGPVGMWRGDTGAEERGGARAAAERRWWPARAWGALGLGVLCGAAWIGAIFAVAFTMQRAVANPAVLRGVGGELAALPTLLGAVVPLGIIVIGEAARRRRTGAVEAQAARFVLVLLGVLAGIAPAYLLVRDVTSSSAGLLIGMIPVVTPGLSVGAALGYVLGARGSDEAARAEGWWRGGTGAALWGGIGFGLSFVGLVVALVVLNTAQPVRCARLPCLSGTFILVEIAAVLMMAAVITVAMAVMGGVAGAWLRVGAVSWPRTR